MRKLGEAGFNALVVPLVLMTIFFLGVSGFAFWAYGERADYKNNVDQKVEAAVEVAVERAKSDKDNEFAEREKQPVKPYTGPATFGTVAVQYPKTWSAHVNESGKGSIPLNGYFHPNFVPGTESGIGYALRIEVVESAYSQELKKYDGQVKQGTVKVSPYFAPKVPATQGARVDGEIAQKKKGSMILLPLRDKTLKVWTEAESFTKDFNEIILPSLTFTP